MTAFCCSAATKPSIDPRWRQALWIALLVNAAMFLLEFAAGELADSRALQADALDFVGDSANYAISLGVAGLALAWRATVALIKGGYNGGSFYPLGCVLGARLMSMWKATFGALMLVLMLWTGGIAHAAEQIQCIPVTAEAAGHFDGDSDQVPSEREKGVAHHHAGCSGHHLAAPGDSSALLIDPSAATMPLPWREAGVPGRGPDNLLRPPIA